MKCTGAPTTKRRTLQKAILRKIYLGASYQSMAELIVSGHRRKSVLEMCRFYFGQRGVMSVDRETIGPSAFAFVPIRRHFGLFLNTDESVDKRRVGLVWGLAHYALSDNVASEDRVNALLDALAVNLYGPRSAVRRLARARIKAAQ